MHQGKGKLLHSAAAAALLWATTVQAGPMSLDGQFSVSESGAATYTIPIQVPPGTGGVEPKLALTYNSQTGNGLLGVGWSLSGLSAITRCPRTLAQDNVRGSVNFDNNDRFCLDGQRLLAVNGTYGADGTEYRTERESYSKIVSYGTAGNGPAWFKVWTKAGQVIEYGNTADSRIEAIKAPNSTATWPTTTARLWAINKVADTKGNYLTYSYTEDQANGDYYPTRIDYTGNSNTGLTPNNSVQFVYEARPDIGPIYEAGAKSRSLVRLSKVQAFANGVLAYDFQGSYGVSNATQRSKLISFRRCAGSACHPPVTLGWGEPAVSFPNTYAWVSPNNYGGNFFPQIADINGDGKSDVYFSREYEGSHMVWIGNGDGSFPTTGANSGYHWISPTGYGTNYSHQLGDFNGDGKADIYLFRKSEGSHMVWMNNGDGTFPSTYSWSSPNGYGTNYEVRLGDFNGDGRTDILMSRDYEGSHMVWLGNGDGTFPTTGPNNGYSWISPSGYGTNYSYQLGDFNGDGRSDLHMFRKGEGSHMVWLNNGDGTFPSTYAWSSPNGYGINYDVRLGDFNGDGRTDIFMSRDYEGSHMVWLGNGDGSFPSTGANNGYSWISPPGYGTNYSYQVADFNGDGRADIHLFRKSEGSHMAWINNGDGTFPTTYAWSSLNGYGINYEARLGDFNGDGRTDIWMSSTGGENVTWHGGVLDVDLVISISMPVGEVVSVGYKSIANDVSSYTKDTGANASVYPKLDIQSPMYVVSSVSSSNGIGGTVTTNYKYGGLKAEIGTGRGLLGFRWMESTQAETGIITRTEYRQDWPYVGLPSIVKKSLPGAGNNGLLSQVSNSYSCLNPQSGSACTISTGNRYFPYLSQSVESSWDLNGTALPIVTTTHQFDAWGNATQVTVGTNDGYSKTTTNQYSNDATNWYLGRLTRSQVQSVTP